MDCIINHFQLDVTIKVPLVVRVFKSQHRNSDIFALIKESIRKCFLRNNGACARTYFTTQRRHRYKSRFLPHKQNVPVTFYCYILYNQRLFYVYNF